MTNLIGPIPPLKGDCLTTTNNGQGLNSTLLNVQDGNGIDSSMLLSTEQAQFSGGVLFNRTSVTTTPYNALSTDYIIAVTANAAGVDIILPAPSANNVGQVFVVQDEVGNANVHNILVSASGSTINGAPGVTLSGSHDGFFFYSNGNGYFCISDAF